MKPNIDNVNRRADRLLDDLVDHGPSTAQEVCKRQGWSTSQFHSAGSFARSHLCGPLGIAVPAPVPDDGWRYHATVEWDTVGTSASYVIGQMERRMERLAADVQIVLPHLERGTQEWRRANFLDKHLRHILGTLEEINGEG